MRRNASDTILMIPDTILMVSDAFEMEFPFQIENNTVIM